jgi:pyrroloquinoline quinone biosynthesis protein B
VRSGLVSGNAIYRTLERFPGQVRWQKTRIGREALLETADGAPSGLTVEPVAAAGKVPLHFEQWIAPTAEDNVGFLIREPARDRTFAYFPCVGAPSGQLLAALERADVVFFDGTFWSSDELVALGMGVRRAEDMAHWPLGGPRGSLEMLSRLRASRKVLVHINNTNPILRDDSPQRRAVTAAGVEVAWDGMDVQA